MIRAIVENQFTDGKKYAELSCLHTDSKPTTGLVTGSLCLEVDTGDVYAFDEVGAQWSVIAELGGGS